MEYMILASSHLHDSKVRFSYTEREGGEKGISEGKGKENKGN